LTARRPKDFGGCTTRQQSVESAQKAPKTISRADWIIGRNPPIIKNK
jgi:hypothetical protein